VIFKLPVATAMEGARTQNWLSPALVVLLLAIAVFFFHSQTTAQAHQMSDLEKALLALMKKLEEEHSKTEDSLRQTQDNLRQTQEKMEEEHSKTEDSLRQTQDHLRQTQEKMEEEHSKTEESLRQTQDSLRQTQVNLRQTQVNLRQTQDKMEQSIRRTQEALGKLSMHSGRPKGVLISCLVPAENVFSEEQKEMLFKEVAPSIVKLVLVQENAVTEGTGFVVRNHSSGELVIVTANHVAMCNETSQALSRHVFVNSSDYFPSARNEDLFRKAFLNPPSNTKLRVSVLSFSAEDDYCFLCLPDGAPFIPPLEPSLEVSRGKVCSRTARFYYSKSH